jgi:hypothetical protein
MPTINWRKIEKAQASGVIGATPSTFQGMNLSNLFGKVEMEQAVKFIINKLIEEGDTWEGESFDIFSFNTEDEQHGFSYLLYYDWMREDGSGNYFVVSKGLIKRLMKRKNEY